MPRRSIGRPAKGTGSVIDAKTGKPVESSLPALCERIRFYRERAGMEQKALAKRIGVTGNAVSNWENGRGRPDINLLPDICAALQISFYELFDVEEPAVRTSRQENRFLEQYRKYPPMASSTSKLNVETMTRYREIMEKAKREGKTLRAEDFE